MRKYILVITSFTLYVLIQFKISSAYYPKNRSNFSGCCSHHEGIKTCDKKAQKIICNDLTYSPSCECQ